MTSPARTEAATLGIAATRLAHAAFFIATAAYCFLNFNPFTYTQFIRPELLRWLPAAVAYHPAGYWAVVLPVLVTLMPRLRRRDFGAWSYLVGAAAAGIYVLVIPVLANVEHTPAALGVGLVALVPIVGLAVIDHIAISPLPLVEMSERRLLLACGGAAFATFAVYAAGAPLWTLKSEPGGGPHPGFPMAWAASLAAHGMVFAAVYGVVGASVAAVGVLRRPLAEYVAIVVLAAIALAVAIFEVVGRTLSFDARGGWLAAAGLAIAISATWSHMAWRTAERLTEPVDALDVWLSPLRFVKVWPVSALVGCAALAHVLGRGVAAFDWDFLFQKLGVLLIWSAVFAAVWAWTPRGPVPSAAGRLRRRMTAVALVAAIIVGMPLARRTLAGADTSGELDVALERYAAVDASFHLIRDLMRPRRGNSAEFYGYLNAHSTLEGRDRVQPIDIDFVAAFAPAETARRPHIFLIVVDSLRRDYLAPYNPAVDFTPALARFAHESVVFERAFTRYGGTALSMPALWAGGMLIHKQYVTPFAPMNALGKLLAAKHYDRIVSPDHIAKQLFIGPDTTLLEGPEQDARDDESWQPGATRRREMDYSVCGKLAEVQSLLSERDGDRPLFMMTRTLELHLANRLSSGRTFLDPQATGLSDSYAARVARLDGCFGSFITFLRQSELLANSIVVFTSDHGESLGEGNRWGHAKPLHPEVVQVPLIVHVPAWLRRGLTADTARLAFTTDITPTLYALLGERPRFRGPLYGEPLFVPAGELPSDRETGEFLVASSHGPVYGLLTHGGRRLYIADAIAGRDSVYDIADPDAPARTTATEAERSASRAAIRRHVGDITSQYVVRRD